jgi:asparagine synthase (glutamine-hydrolysing)
MCGIGGFNWEDQDRIRKMMAVMVHRGPDDEGYYFDESISLGHRRLSIIDLSSAGRQPMKNSDDTIWIVYNGEVYNYLELREELIALGHTFDSKTDTEVIINAYEEWGIDCLNKFNGMFAFCIYDKNKKIFFLARDRFGIKPLYYFEHNSQFAFSSEIKGLLIFDSVSREADDHVIFDYLMFNCYDHLPQTFFKGIQRILPGHYLIYDLKDHMLENKKWYDIPVQAQSNMDFEKGRDRFLELFIDAIRLRLRSDVEVGSCLSGGIDSSSIVCVLDKFLLKKNRSRRFKTFSVVFPGTDIDETGFIENVRSRAEDVDYYSIHPAIDDLINDMEMLIKYQEEPFGATSIFAQWEVMKLASQYKMKVLLDGQGADELLAGYVFLYGYYFLELIYQFNFGHLVKELILYKRFQLVNYGLLFPFFLMVPSRVKTLLWDIYFHHCLDKTFINRYLKDSDIPLLMYQPVDLKKGLYYRMKYGLPLLLREEDRNSMAFSIETRLPFLDYRIVEFMFSMPSHFKVKNGTTKYILREAMQGILPEPVRMRRSKFGFSTPMDEWFREEKMIKIMRGILNSKTFRARGYYHLPNLNNFFGKHIEGKVNFGQTLWKLLNLEIWRRIYIEKEDDVIIKICH